MKLAILSMLHALQIGMAVFGFYENKQTHPTGKKIYIECGPPLKPNLFLDVDLKATREKKALFFMCFLLCDSKVSHGNLVWVWLHMLPCIFFLLGLLALPTL